MDFLSEHQKIEKKIHELRHFEWNIGHNPLVNKELILSEEMQIR